MTSKPVKAYFADAADIKALMQKVIEKSAGNGLPVSSFGAAAENPLQEMHLGKLIHNVLCETNGRSGFAWIVRQAPENRYFVLLSAGSEYLQNIAKKFCDAFKSHSIKVSMSMVVAPEQGTSREKAEFIYDTLCQKMNALEDACLSI